MITMEGHVTAFGHSLWWFLHNRFSSNETKAASLHKRSALCPTQASIAPAWSPFPWGWALNRFWPFQKSRKSRLLLLGIFRSTVTAVSALSRITIYWRLPFRAWRTQEPFLPLFSPPTPQGTFAFLSLQLSGPFFCFCNLLPEPTQPSGLTSITSVTF